MSLQTDIVESLRQQLREQLPNRLPDRFQLEVLNDDDEPEAKADTIQIYVHDGEDEVQLQPARTGSDRKIVTLRMDVECYMPRVTKASREILRGLLLSVRCIVGDEGPASIQEQTLRWRATSSARPAVAPGSHLTVAVQRLECDHWETLS